MTYSRNTLFKKSLDALNSSSVLSSLNVVIKGSFPDSTVLKHPVVVVRPFSLPRSNSGYLANYRFFDYDPILTIEGFAVTDAILDQILDEVEDVICSIDWTTVGLSINNVDDSRDIDPLGFGLTNEKSSLSYFILTVSFRGASS